VIWSGCERHAIEYAQFCSGSHRAAIRVYDEAGNVIETHEHAAISKSGELSSVASVLDMKCSEISDSD
jgi:hypothetical protein